MARVNEGNKTREAWRHKCGKITLLREEASPVWPLRVSGSPSREEAPLHTVLILAGLNNKVTHILLLASYRNAMYISINPRGELLRGVWGSPQVQKRSCRHQGDSRDLQAWLYFFEFTR